MRRLLLIFFLLPTLAFAAIGSGTQWDIQPTGANTNGGGYDPGVVSPGTNESMGSGTAITITLASGTTGTGSPAITSTTHGPGNFIHIASGSGCTAGWYEILSQSSGTATFSSTMGSASDTCTGVVGGSLLTPNEALDVTAVTGNTVWIQTGTYTSSSTIDVNGTNFLNGAVTGYGTVHGDNGTAPLITTATNVALITFINGGAGSIVFTNLSFSTTAGTKNIGMLSDSGATYDLIVVNCTFNGFSNAINGDFSGLDDQFASIQAIGNLFENTTSNAIILTGSTAGVTAKYNVFKSIGADGIQVGSSVPVIAIRNIFSTVTGRGIAQTGSAKYQNTIEGNDFSSVTGDAVFVSALLSTEQVALDIENNIFYGGGASAVAITTLNSQIAYGQYNAYGSNTSSNVNFPAGTGDVSLSANPWVSSTNFALNSTAGGGAALKQVGFPGVFPGGTTTSYLDIGAVNEAAGGTTTYANFGDSH